jgi:Holin of 3TMs, for gene-transfer release
MGLISGILAFLGRPDRTALTELLTRMAEEGDDADLDLTPRQRSGYDRAVDALNRLPRPLMAFGTVIMLVTAMVAPVWFGDRMEALAAMPDALWWVIGAVISLYFGARFQTKEQGFQRELVETIVRAPVSGPVAGPITPRMAETGVDAALGIAAATPADNPALADWATLTPA